MPSLCRADDGIRRIAADDAAVARAVVVSGQELVHTAQLFPLDQHGELIGADNPDKQVQRVLDALVDVLAAQQAKPAGLIKLNVYLADESALKPLFNALRIRFHDTPPALSLVTTRLPIDGALVAVDAVAARPLTITDGRPILRHEATVAGREHMAHSAVLPVGETIYVAGQAEPGPDLAAATSATLAGLKKTLDHLGLGLEHVVQLKCFLQPMAEAGAAFGAIEQFFDGQIAPPTSVVEWISSLPIEIEMIVHCPTDTPGDGVTHEWLPWLTNSPVYCRLARVHGNTQIFISGCYGDPHDDEGAQVNDVFEALQDRLADAGSDLRHMAKATYYVRNEAASAAVNEIRPTLYDPEHPPAASKALVYGVGQPQAAVTLDMIAVPADE